MTLTELRNKYEWLDYYCTCREIEETDDGKVYFLIDKIELDDLIYRYFVDGYNWTLEDEGYELEDCDTYLKYAKEYGDQEYIEWFEQLKKQLINKEPTTCK